MCCFSSFTLLRISEICFLICCYFYFRWFDIIYYYNFHSVQDLITENIKLQEYNYFLFNNPLKSGVKMGREIFKK